MTFAGAPLSLVGPALLAGGLAITALYLLKLRRRRVSVPFSTLWQRVLKDSQSTALHRRLKRILSLLLQLLVLTLVLLAVGDPRLGASQRGRTVVLLVDTSASMQAVTRSSRTRLEEAVREARKQVRALSADDSAMVISLDGRPAPLGGLTSDDRELDAQIDSLTATDTPADPERALRLAKDALSGHSNPTILWISDGAYDPAALVRIHRSGSQAEDGEGISLDGIDVRFQPVGDVLADNLAITAFAVRRYRANQTAYEVLVEAASFAERETAAELELLQEGEPVEVERLTLRPGERIQRIYPNLAGEGTRLEARLSRPDRADRPEVRLDALAADDRAYAVLPPRRKQKVLLVTGGDLFLEGALLLDQNLEVEKIAPADYHAEASARFDAVVFDGVTPDEPPRTHALYLDPKGPSSPFSIKGEIDAPYLTDVQRDHPLMRWVALKDLNIARASRFALEPGDVAVASSVRDPIIVARDRTVGEARGKGAWKTVALGFSLRKSDLPLRVAFPVLLINALEWFAGGDAGIVDAYPTGRALRLPIGSVVGPASTAQVIRPDGRTLLVPVHDGRAAFYAERSGFYQLSSDPGEGGHSTTEKGSPRLFAANLTSAVESRIVAHPQLSLDGVPLPVPEAVRVRISVRRVLWPYFVALALMLALAEWWTYNRRVTV